MFSLWGNIQAPAPPNAEEKDKGRFYYSTTSGQILSADGAGYVIPDMGKLSPETRDYIPRDVAMAKVKELLDESKALRETYEQNLQNVDTFYKKAIDQSKTHYETIIHEMKTKALRHVEVQRIMKQQMEEKLTKELAQSEHELEELRDTMAARNLQYKEEVRALKGKIADAETEVANVQNQLSEQIIRASVSQVVTELAHAVEKQDEEEQKMKLLSDIHNQLDASEQAHQEALQDAHSVHQEALNLLLREQDDRNVCQEVLLEIQSTLEIRDLNEHLLAFETTRQELTQWQEKAEVYEVEIAQKAAALLEVQQELEQWTARSGDLNVEIARLQALHEEENQRLREEHDAATKQLKGKFSSVLNKTKASRDRAEVELTMLAMKEVLLERALVDTSSEHATQIQHASHDQTLVLQAVQAEHEHIVQQLRDETAERITRMKREMKKVVEKLKADNSKLLVQSVLHQMVATVVDRHTVETQSALAKEKKENEEKGLKERDLKEGEKEEVAREVQVLRDQLLMAQAELAQQKALFLQETSQRAPPPEAKQSAVGGDGIVNEAATASDEGSAVPVPVNAVDEVSVPVTVAAENENENVLKMKDVQLNDNDRQRLVTLQARLQEIQTTLTSNEQEVATLNTTLVPLVEERDAVKNEIRLWTKQFKEVNGRDPEVADKATIRDKFQRYKVTSTRAKELETKRDDLLLVQAPNLQKEEKYVELDIQQLKEKLQRLQAEEAKRHQQQVQLPLRQLQQSTASGEGGSVMMLRAQVDVEEREVQVDVSELRLLAMSTGSVRKLNTFPLASPRGNNNADGNAAGASEADALRNQLNETTQQYEAAIEQLEDSLYATKDSLAALQTQHTLLQTERDILHRELDALIEAKRTDVIARYEKDLARLNESESALQEQVTSLQTEKVKLETRVQELKERAERAEQDLHDRAMREQQQLNPQDEKAILSKELNKQRETVIQKSKAATAGWDAAANADEKLDVEVQRAYQRGIKEERARHAQDLASTNEALEAKEARITQLLVSVAAMEKTLAANELSKQEMAQQMQAMQLEVADAIAAIQSTAGGSGGRGGGDDGDGEGGGVTMGPSEAELDAAREQLDAAQEELVALQEKCDVLESDLYLAQKKNRLFERLVASGGLQDPTNDNSNNANTSNANSNSGNNNNGSGKSAYAQYNIDEAISDMKRAIVKGTNLWKSNRKDDCYDVYLDCCLNGAQKVYSDELVRPLRDAVEHGKAVGAMNKQKGAIFFRKAIDRFMADAGQPSCALYRNEQETLAALRAKEDSAKNASALQKSQSVAEVQNELATLNESLYAQGYTAENNPTIAPRSPRAVAAGDNDEPPAPADKGASASSLLQRAKTAEALVQSLRRQMAAIIAATAANTAVTMQNETSNITNTGAPSSNAPSASTQPASNTPAAVPASAALSNIRAANNSNNNNADAGRSAAEVRRLQRKIKELEAEITKMSAQGGGGASSAELKAAQQNEKNLQKKLKDAEANAKRDVKAIEMRASKAEHALQKIQSTFDSVTSERDTLRADNAKLITATKELGELRIKAESAAQLTETLAARDQELALLSEQFKKESALRKKYKNELEDLKGAIRVYARCRPMAAYEIQRGSKQVVTIKDDTSLKVTTSRGEKDFEFDAVFGPMSTQDQVFEDTKRLVESCLDGFNVCVFAYGQTGSGKTHTMTGNPSNPGLTPKVCEELYRLIDEKKHCQCKVTTYFIELYNDNLVDLYFILDNKTNKTNLEPPKLDIKMDAKKMVTIRNAVMKDVSSPQELMELFHKGNAERHTGATKMNAESSRSHSIFAIMVESLDTTSKRTTLGKLSLVDLAGSERADKTGASAERLKEAQNINKSLSALGDVIAALSEGNAKFIPYRNNKLTQLMQDSLGGNAKTLMFVNFSPADYNADETTTSLMYAARVKKIVNNASKAAESEEVAKLKAIIKRLQSGQAVAIEEIDGGGQMDAVAEEPPQEDDGKVYDGY